MSRIMFIVFVAAGAGIALVGGDSHAAQAIAPPTRIPAPPARTIPGETVPTSTIPREVRRAVVADAAQRFRVEQTAVVLASAEKVTWPDSALGCQEPGRVYAQARVPGFRVVARTLAGEMLYHTDTHGSVVNCARLITAER